MTQIAEAIKKLAGHPLHTASVTVGEVKSVDMNALTCVVKVEEGYDRLDVRLRATEGGSSAGLIIIPKVGSQVLIGMIENDPRMTVVCGFTELDSVLMKNHSGASLLLKDNGETHLHGDQFNGLVKVGVLQQNLDSLKAYVEAMNAALPGAFSAVGVGTAANGGTGASAYTSSMAGQVINLQNMENTKVKHG